MSDVYPRFGAREQAIAVQWESDGNGDAEIDMGWVECATYHSFISIPGEGVTDNFDVTISANILLSDGVTVVLDDVMQGYANNLSNDTGGESTQLAIQTTIAYNHGLTMYVSNAGANKSGTFIVNVWEESR